MVRAIFFIDQRNEMADTLRIVRLHSLEDKEELYEKVIKTFNFTAVTSHQFAISANLPWMWVLAAKMDGKYMTD